MAVVVDITDARGVPCGDMATTLARLFPVADEYGIRTPDGRSLVMRTSAPAAYAADPLTLFQACFPRDGRYVIGRREEFAKAVRERPYPPFEEWFLTRLFQHAQAQFLTTRDVLRRAVEDFVALHGGKLTDTANLQRFEDLLFELRQAIRWSVANPIPPAVEQQLRQLGFQDRDVLDWPGLSYRLGLIDQDLRRLGSQWQWPEVFRHAATRPLTPDDEAAIVIARQTAGTLLTPVHLKLPEALHAAALNRERQVVREMTVEAIRTEQHPKQLASDLYHRLGAEQTRDWERVARTEIQDVRCRGAFEAERRGRGWNDDTLVYRRVATNPCSGCLKLYVNLDGTPRLYTVRELQTEDAKGYNRGSHKDYHARIGATHPAELCSTWATHHPALAGLFARTAPAMRTLLAERGLLESNDS